MVSTKRAIATGFAGWVEFWLVLGWSSYWLLIVVKLIKMRQFLLLILGSLWWLD